MNQSVGFRRICLAVVCLLWFGAIALRATDYYVVTNGTPADPYTNWTMAGTGIIDVVNAAMTNTGSRTVWVSNGVYILTNTIYVTNAITIQSVNGKTNTFIDGHYPTITTQCFNFANGCGANLDGFTVMHGAFVHSDSSWVGGGGIFNRGGGVVRNCSIVSNYLLGVGNGNGDGGGGIWTGNGSSILSNCFIAYNSSSNSGGGVALRQGLVVDCIIVSNYAYYLGGGVCIYDAGGTLKNSTSAYNTGCTVADGKGIYFGQSGTATNCVFINNDVKMYRFGTLANSEVRNSTGRGVYMSGASPWPNSMNVLNCLIVSNGEAVIAYQDCLISNCKITGNNSSGVQLFQSAIIRNSLVANNYRSAAGGGICMDSSSSGTVQNCTIVSNSSGTSGGGVYVSTNGSVVNSIIYSNSAPANMGSNWYYASASIVSLTNCCTTPTNGLTGTGNIPNYPSFVNFAGGDYHLAPNSPCINTGTNDLSWMTNSYDLDGRQRIRYGTVDMGAYERINKGAIFSFH